MIDDGTYHAIKGAGALSRLFFAAAPCRLARLAASGVFLGIMFGLIRRNYL